MDDNIDPRVDYLQARVIALQIATAILLQDGPPGTRAAIRRSANSAEALGLPFPLTDEQIEQIRQNLLTLDAQ